MELIDIYDENNKPLNKKIDREIAHKEGMWHRESVVIVLNENNKILLQKRSYKRHNYPGKWGLMAGHVKSGDTPKATAVKELKEEIGLEVLQKDLRFLELYIRNEKSNKAFIYIYVVRTNKKANEYIIQKEELTQVKYYSINSLIRRIKRKDKKLVFGNDPLHIEMFTLLDNLTI